jgi:glycerol-3-phosphate acyltransferase PlsY
MKRIFIKLLLYDGFYGLFHRMIAESQPTIAPFMPLFAFLISYGMGYLLGSIPFGLLLTKLAGMGDIRTIGSGNIGATNVLRTGKKGLAALTLVCDALKGVVAVMIGQHYTPTLGLVAGVAALLGHSYPIWLKYKGGKGVATAFGFSCALNLPMGAAIGFTWIVVLVMVRYSSVAALSAAALAPLYAWLFGNTQLMLAYVGISSFIIWRHRANIKRLLNGTEGTLSLGSKNKTAASPTTESSPDTAADETSPPE